MYYMQTNRREREMIALGCDHGGYDLKQEIKKYLEAQNLEFRDFGCMDKSSCDYPVYGRAAAEAVAKGECDRGIVVCTTGIGISITANKIPGIRCALCGDATSARLTRLHNNANMLALGAGIIGTNQALDIVAAFLHTEFSGEERHQRRIDQIEK